MAKILLIDSANKADPALKRIIGRLEERGEAFFYLVAAPDWGGKKVFFGPKPAGFFGVISFLVLLPFLRLAFFPQLFFLKGRKKIEAVILKSDREKLIVSFLCRLFGLKSIWLFMPDDECSQKSKFTIFLLRIAARRSLIVVFTEAKKNELITLGFKAESVQNISLGIETAAAGEQENIFSKIARASGPFHLKHFTIGAVADLGSRKQFENFFRALAICAKMIPGLQVIIVGEGEERKNLSWLAKKMELGKIVWFVGEQANIRKWLESFDIFAAIFQHPSLSDLNVVLEAMFCRRPLVGVDSPGLRSLVIPGETGFLAEFADAEALAEKILALEQDSLLRNRFAEKAGRLAETAYVLEDQLKKLKTIIAYEKKN